MKVTGPTLAVQEAVDMPDLSTAPAAPDLGRKLAYFRGGMFYAKDSAGVERSFGEGAGIIDGGGPSDTYSANSPTPYVCTSTTRPASPSTGLIIYETDTDRIQHWTGTAWSQRNQGQPIDQLYAGNVANGTATTLTTYLTQNSVLLAPCALTMIVDVFATEGANGLSNQVTHAVLDEGGTQINHGIVNFAQPNANHGINTLLTVAFRGSKGYTAGQTCGFRLQYKVSASNIYIDASARVSFVPT